MVERATEDYRYTWSALMPVPSKIVLERKRKPSSNPYKSSNDSYAAGAAESELRLTTKEYAAGAGSKKFIMAPRQRLKKISLQNRIKIETEWFET